MKQGRLVRPRSDLFMQHFLASRIGEDMLIKHLFVEYKHWIERTNPFARLDPGRISGARLAGRPFPADRLNPRRAIPIYRLAVFLEAFDIRTTYPLLLALLDAQISPSEWE